MAGSTQFICNAFQLSRHVRVINETDRAYAHIHTFGEQIQLARLGLLVAAVSHVMSYKCL